MWEYLSKLPVIYSFVLLLLAIIAVLIISLRGRIMAKWGKNQINLGDVSKKEMENKNDKSQNIPVKLPKRSCGDCVLIMMGEREKYEIKMRHAYDSVLKKQMNFVEQKLVEMQAIFIDMYTELYGYKKQNTDAENGDTEAIQSKLFYGLLRDALVNVKDELRRSFKENGFFSQSGSDFSNYVKDKVKVIINKISQHMRNLYPINKMVIPVNETIDNIEKSSHKIEDIMFEIYTAAKEIKIDAEKLEKDLRTEFSQWIDTFVS